MKKGFIAQILPLLFIFAVTCLIFFKIFLKGLYPVPGDLLVSFYFPWYSGSWEGYNPWTTHKELLGADSIRQIYVWKEFALNQIKKGEFPLWNPYTFSGQPLAANFQSSVYYPFNFFYYLTDPRNAWILLIVVQPLLGGIFMYMLIKSFRISSLGSVFGATAFMFSSYMITWMENGNISHSYIWLPFSFWAINNFFEKFKIRYLLLLSISLTLSILAGHPQTAIYIYIATSIFYICKLYKQKASLRIFVYFIFTVASSLALSAIQLIPTYLFYRDSPIFLPFAQKEIFLRSIIPFKNLITIFVSDFYGHPANNNFWSQNYGDFTPYFGVIPLIFTLWAVVHLWKRNLVKFLMIFLAIFILAATKGPLTFLIATLNPPLLDATTPSRFISVSIFLAIILAAIGFDNFIKNFQSKKYLRIFLKFLMPLAGIYAMLWLFAIFGKFVLHPQETWLINLAVTRRNLILPTLMFLSIPVGTLIVITIREKMKMKELSAKIFLVVGFFIVVLIGGVYYTNKFLPVSPKKFIFPDHPLFYWLKNNAGIDRFYGGGTAHIDFNFPTHYKVYGIEGYDTLRYGRYAELMASSFNGKVPETYLRSDGVVPNEENGYRKRLFELLGVKYLLDKEDNPKTGADWHYERFPNDKIEGFWQYDKFQVYKRKPTLPRVFMTTTYYVAQNDQEIIQKIYDSSFPLERVILEKNPPLTISENQKGPVIPKLIKYEPNEIVVSSNLDYNALLFISDAYDRDWKAYIDGNESEVLRASYALRSIAVEKGDHQISFKYQPKSFTYGLMISILSIIGLVIFATNSAIRKKF